MNSENKQMDIQALIKQATRSLQKLQRTGLGDNEPLYPTMVIFLGEKASESYEIMRGYMERNWGDYCEYVPYLSFVSMGGKIQLENLVTQETGILGEENDLVDQSFQAILGVGDTIFPNRTRVKIEYVMSSDEETWEDLYEKAIEVGKHYPFTMLRTLYLMLSQTTKKRKENARTVIKGLEEKRTQGKKMNSVFLFSDFLQAGILTGEKRNENFCLTSELILLGGNRRRNGNIDTQLDWLYGSGEFKTASFSRVEKPEKEIVVATLYHVVDSLKNKLENNYSCPEIGQIKNKLGLEQGISEMSTAFQQIQKGFPPEEALRYMPGQISRTGSLQDYARQTKGCSELFYKKYFEKPVKNWGREKGEKASRSLASAWSSKLTYRDILKYFPREGETQESELFRALKNISLTGRGSALYGAMVQASADVFCKEFLENLKRELGKQHEKAAVFEQMIEDVCRGLERENNMHAGTALKDNIDNYYKAKISQQIEFVISQEEISDLFCVENDRNRFLEKLLDIFKKVIKSNLLGAEFRASFEEELANRLSNVSEGKRYEYITQELEGANLSSYMRLQMTGATQIPWTVYVMNADAGYARAMNIDQTVQRIDLRTDVFEKLMVQNVEERTINYMLEGE